MIPFLIICAAVIAAIVAGYYAWLYWPGKYVVYGEWSDDGECVHLATIVNRKDLELWLSMVDDYSSFYSKICVYKYLKSKDGLKLIKTIKWS